MTIKNAFFEDLAATLDSWVSASVEALTDMNTDFIWFDKPEYFAKLRVALNQAEITPDEVKQVFTEIIRGVLVSILTSIDGGTALTGEGLISLVDEQGQTLGDDLHNEFVTYLIETGRLGLE